MFTQVGVKQLTDFLRTVTAASDLVDCTLVNCAKYLWCVPVRRDVPVGVPLDLSTPTGMSCIGTYGDNCKSGNVSKYRVL